MVTDEGPEDESEDEESEASGVVDLARGYASDGSVYFSSDHGDAVEPSFIDDQSEVEGTLFEQVDDDERGSGSDIDEGENEPSGSGVCTRNSGDAHGEPAHGADEYRAKRAFLHDYLNSAPSTMVDAFIRLLCRA